MAKAKSKSDEEIVVDESEKNSKKKETSETSIENKKKALLEKAAKMKEKLDETAATSEELKEKVKLKKKEDFLLPLEDYVKSGIYLGTKVVTPDMKKFVYRRRADGLAIFNTDLIDEKLKDGIAFLKQFNPEDIIIVCKRQAGWKAVDLFSQMTGIRVFTKKYPAGILTNPRLPTFFETKLVVICDPWLDKNALNDALKVNSQVLMICDTNNFSQGANKVVIGNNKSSRSLGLIFYLLTQAYTEAKGMKVKMPSLEFFEGEEDMRVQSVSPSAAIAEVKKEVKAEKELEQAVAEEVSVEKKE